MHNRIALAALVVLGACAPAAETPEQRTARMQADSDSARAQITAAMASFQTHLNANHADSVATFYAQNAVMLPEGMPAIEGRDNIRAAFAGMTQEMGAGEMHFTVQNVVANGDMAVERGRWHWQPAAGNRMPADSGKYLARWTKDGGRWVMVEDIWNSDVMKVPAPPTRRGG